MKLIFSKFTLFLITISLFSCGGSSQTGINQNIVEVLYTLPSDVDLPHKPEELKKAINAFFNKQNNNIDQDSKSFSFDVIDLKYGSAKYSANKVGTSYLNGAIQLFKVSDQEYLIGRYYAIFNVNDQPETKLQFYSYDGKNISPISTKEMLPNFDSFKQSYYNFSSTAARNDSVNLALIHEAIDKQVVLVNFINYEVEGEKDKSGKAKKIVINKLELSLSTLSGLSKTIEDNIIYSETHGATTYILQKGEFIKQGEDN